MPAKLQTRTGMTGVRRLVAAIGAATKKPKRAPTEALRLAEPAIHPRREHTRGDSQASAAPPTTAPAKRPAFPAALPGIEPATAPKPLSSQTRMSVATGFMSVPR